ncbi:MAG: hypothetical protein GY835_19375, partial [bacterium]|nr:hypothetical protein [bacterium]
MGAQRNIGSRGFAAGAWPIELVDDAVQFNIGDSVSSEQTAKKGRDLRTLTLRDLDSAAKSEAPPAPAKTGSSFPCNPYKYHYSGYGPGYQGSSAVLHLPPVDNDCDGQFNEDPIDGLDNDGDGDLDEDPVFCGDSILSWLSDDSRLGEIATGDTG